MSIARARWLALLALGTGLTAARPCPATVALQLAGKTAFADAPVLHLTAVNHGDEPAEGVTPEVTFEHQHVTGAAVSLAPSARHEWQLSLPVPGGPGTFAAITHVRFADAAGAHSLPLVVPVATPAAPPSPLRTSLVTEPGPGYSRARLLIDNPDTRPVAGRVIFVLPGELHTEPESEAVQVTAGGQRVVPFALEARGAQPGTAYPVYVLLEYMDDAVHHAVVASTETTVPIGTSGRAVPLAVGGLTLALTLGLLAVALRRAAARKGPEPPRR